MAAGIARNRNTDEEDDSGEEQEQARTRREKKAIRSQGAGSEESHGPDTRAPGSNSDSCEESETAGLRRYMAKVAARHNGSAGRGNWANESGASESDEIWVKSSSEPENEDESSYDSSEEEEESRGAYAMSWKEYERHERSNAGSRRRVRQDWEDQPLFSTDSARPALRRTIRS